MGNFSFHLGVDLFVHFCARTVDLIAVTRYRVIFALVFDPPTSRRYSDALLLIEMNDESNRSRKRVDQCRTKVNY